MVVTREHDDRRMSGEIHGTGNSVININILIINIEDSEVLYIIIFTCEEVLKAALLSLILANALCFEIAPLAEE